MPLVLTQCPESRNLVPTGVDVFSRNDLAPTNTLVACPDCGDDHDWEPEDAVLVANGTPAT